jgi:predicted DNA-binding transcriptional regulator AlpA
MPKLIASEDLPQKKGITLKNARRLELESQGLFPKRVYVSERKHAYVESEIDAHIEAKISERDAKLADCGFVSIDISKLVEP